MTTRQLARRSLTIVGVALIVLLAVAAVRTSAIWTEANAPLDTTPVSPATLEARLAGEQARSAALTEQLSALRNHADDLAAALAAAQDRLAADAGEADALSAELAAARDRLATLEASIRAAERATATATRAGAATAPTSGHAHGDDHDDEADDD